MKKDEIMDEELTGMVNYADETVMAEMPVMECKPAPKEESKHENVYDAEYAPVFTGKRTDLQRIGSGLRWLVPCAGIAWLLWIFWMNDLMAMKAAYPCIFVCGCIGFGGFCWNARV